MEASNWIRKDKAVVFHHGPRHVLRVSLWREHRRRMIGMTRPWYFTMDPVLYVRCKRVKSNSEQCIVKKAGFHRITMERTYFRYAEEDHRPTC